MPAPIWAVGTAIQIGASLYGGSRAKKAAKKQSRAIWQQTLEEASRLEDQQRDNLSVAKSNIYGASGVKMSGTALQQINMIDADQQNDLDWLLRSGRQAASEVKKGGQAAWYQSVLNSVAVGVSDYTTNEVTE